MIEVELKEIDSQSTPLTGAPLNSTALSNLKQMERDPRQINFEEEPVYPDLFTGYINPNSTFSVMWSIVILFAIYVFLIEIAFIIGFGSSFWVGELKDRHTIGLLTSLIILLLLDVFMGFFRGYYRVGTGRVETDQKLIRQNYLRTFFWIDVISAICVMIPFIVKQFVFDLFQLFFLLKFFKKGYYVSQIQRIIQHRQGLSVTFHLLVLALDTLVVAHFVACGFIGLDRMLWRVQYFGDNSAYYWLSNNSSYSIDLIGSVWYLQYIYGQQYSTGTLSTLAPGPFGKDPIQILYVIVVMFGFIIMTSYMADGIVRIFFSQEMRRVFHETNIQAFDNYLKLKRVSKSVKQRVQNYFEMVWEVEGKMQSDFQKQVIDKLSLKLKYELMLELVDIKVVKLLQYFPKQQLFIKEVVLAIEEILTDSNQLLFEPDMYGRPQKKLYILSAGMAKFFYGKRLSSPVILGLSNLDKIIGVYEFVTDQEYYYSAETLHISHFHVISTSGFQTILNNLQLREHFLELRDRVLLNGRIDLVDKTCLICMASHLQLTCPKLNISYQIRNNWKTLDNKRAKFQRRNNRSEKRLIVTKQKHLALKKKNSLFLGLEGLFPLGELISSILQLKNEDVDTWAQYSHYFSTDNIKSIKI